MLNFIRGKKKLHQSKEQNWIHDVEPFNLKQVSAESSPVSAERIKSSRMQEIKHTSHLDSFAEEYFEK